MRLAFLAVLSIVATSALAQTPAPELHGYVSLRGISVEAQPSWTEHGFGRFDVGARDAGDRRTVNVDIAQLGFDWLPKPWLYLHADGIARREPSGTAGDRAGIVQAFVDLFSDKWRLRAGSFWLPSSRENTDPMWTSPYSITYSALNSWIGQEVRPVGVDLQYTPNFYVVAGVTAFRGNDTMGTALAERGWTLGNRLVAYGEELPLPPGEVPATPVGRDLDDRTGYAERLRVQLPERAILQVMHVDNRAALVPILRGQEPWRSKFDVVSASVGANAATTLAAEWSSGWTAVGFPGGSFTADFDTAYLLVSHKWQRERLTARVERFSVRDAARAALDFSQEHGHATTLAWFHEATPHLRLGIEYVRVTGQREGLALLGRDPRTGGRTMTVEARYGF